MKIELPKKLRWPAEWEEHEATWIAWPHHEEDWPGKLSSITWVYAEIVRHLVAGERVEILCHDDSVKNQALRCLEAHGVSSGRYRLHVVPNNRSWLRDSAPTAVTIDGKIHWVSWRFNGWAKYANHQLDLKVAPQVSRISGLPLIEAVSHVTGERLVLEGGAIDGDGRGTLLTSEECLLSDVQQRNSGHNKADYERVFKEYLGVEHTIWLDRGIVGDDTHGHIDDIARFVAPGKVVLAFEDDPRDPNHHTSVENCNRLSAARDSAGNRFEVTKLPMPDPVMFDGEMLPASYCNFYIANSVVLVPTFNDPNDRLALGILADLFPDHRVVGIHSVDLVLGLGTLHCLTQQQPR